VTPLRVLSYLFIVVAMSAFAFAGRPSRTYEVSPEANKPEAATALHAELKRRGYAPKVGLGGAIVEIPDASMGELLKLDLIGGLRPAGRGALQITSWCPPQTRMEDQYVVELAEGVDEAYAQRLATATGASLRRSRAKSSSWIASIPSARIGAFLRDRRLTQVTARCEATVTTTCRPKEKPYSDLLVIGYSFDYYEDSTQSDEKRAATIIKAYGIEDAVPRHRWVAGRIPAERIKSLLADERIEVVYADCQRTSQRYVPYDCAGPRAGAGFYSVYLARTLRRPSDFADELKRRGISVYEVEDEEITINGPSPPQLEWVAARAEVDRIERNCPPPSWEKGPGRPLKPAYPGSIPAIPRTVPPAAPTPPPPPAEPVRAPPPAPIFRQSPLPPQSP